MPGDGHDRHPVHRPVDRAEGGVEGAVGGHHHGEVRVAVAVQRADQRVVVDDVDVGVAHRVVRGDDVPQLDRGVAAHRCPAVGGLGAGDVGDRAGAVGGGGEQHLVAGLHQTPGQPVDDGLGAAVGRGRHRHPGRGEQADVHPLRGQGEGVAGHRSGGAGPGGCGCGGRGPGGCGAGVHGSRFLGGAAADRSMTVAATVPAPSAEFPIPARFRPHRPASAVRSACREGGTVSPWASSAAWETSSRWARWWTRPPRHRGEPGARPVSGPRRRDGSVTAVALASAVAVLFRGSSLTVASGLG